MYFSIVPVLLVTHLLSTQMASARGQAVSIFNKREYIREMPEPCEGMSYCFEEGDYPRDKVDYLLENITLVQMEQDYNEYGSRSGVDGGPHLCVYNSIKDKPIYYIIDNYDEVRVVIQKKNRFEQNFTTNWCLNEGRIRHDTTHFLQSTTLQQFEIECVTTTMNYDFFVLSEDSDNKIDIVQAKGGIPVCCKCQYNVD